MLPAQPQSFILHFHLRYSRAQSHLNRINRKISSSILRDTPPKHLSCCCPNAKREISTLAPMQKSAARCRFCGILESALLARFGGVSPLAEIRVQEGEPLENALRRFKRKVQTEDIIKEVKRHSFYLKPGEKKRVKEALARKRNRKKIRKEQD
jgi:small subunit ribosomal protein S21